MRIASLAVIGGLVVCLAACTTTSGGARVQSASEVREILANMAPTTKLVVDARPLILEKAARGYMTKAFPLSEADSTPVSAPPEGPLVLETETIEWFADGMPHRTRVRVEVFADPVVPRHRRLEIRAQMIEPEYALAEATPGKPLGVAWRLVGSNPKIEELVQQQIMNRYLALVENRPIAEDSEWVVPVAEPPKTQPRG